MEVTIREAETLNYEETQKGLMLVVDQQLQKRMLQLSIMEYGYLAYAQYAACLH